MIPAGNFYAETGIKKEKTGILKGILNHLSGTNTYTESERQVD